MNFAISGKSPTLETPLKIALFVTSVTLVYGLAHTIPKIRPTIWEMLYLAGFIPLQLATIVWPYFPGEKKRGGGERHALICCFVFSSDQSIRIYATIVNLNVYEFGSNMDVVKALPVHE